MSKYPQGKVDSFRSTINSDRDAEFIRIASLPNQNITSLHRWLCDEGYKGSYQSVCNWHESWRKSGKKAEALNKLTSEYIGVIPEQALQKILVEFANLLDLSLEQVLSAPDEDIKAVDYLKQLPHIAREVRSCAEAINQLKYVGDRKAAELAGAMRVITELRLIYQDTPTESSIEEAIKSITARLEDG